MVNEGNNQAAQRQASIIAQQQQAAAQFALFNAKQVSGQGKSPAQYQQDRQNAYLEGLAASGVTPGSSPLHAAIAAKAGIDISGLAPSNRPSVSTEASGFMQQQSQIEQKLESQDQVPASRPPPLLLSDEDTTPRKRSGVSGYADFFGATGSAKGISTSLTKGKNVSQDQLDAAATKGLQAGLDKGGPGYFGDSRTVYGDIVDVKARPSPSGKGFLFEQPNQALGSLITPDSKTPSLAGIPLFGNKQTSNNISTNNGLVTIYTSLGSKGQVVVPSAPEQKEYVYPPLVSFSSSMINGAKSYGADSLFILNENGKQIDRIPLKSADRVLPLALQSYSSLGTKVKVGFTPNPDNLTSKDTGKVKLPPDSTFTQAKDVAKGIGAYLWSIPETIAKDIQTGKTEGGRLNIFTGQYEGGISGPEVSPSASPAYKAGVEIGSVLPYIFAFGPSKGSPKPVGSSSYFTDLFNPVKSTPSKGSADIGLNLGEKTKAQQYSNDYFNLFNRDLAGEPKPIPPPKTPSGGGGPKFTSTTVNLGRGIGQLVPFGANGAILGPPSKPTPPSNKPSETKPPTKEIKSGGSSLLLQEQEQKSIFKEYPILLGEGEGQVVKTEQATKTEPKVEQAMQQYLNTLKKQRQSNPESYFQDFIYAYPPGTKQNQVFGQLFQPTTTKQKQPQPPILFNPQTQKPKQPTRPIQPSFFFPEPTKPKVPQITVFGWPPYNPPRQTQPPIYPPFNPPRSPPELPPPEPPTTPPIKPPEEPPKPPEGGNLFFPFAPFGGRDRPEPSPKKGKKSYILYSTNPFAVGEFYTKGLPEQTVSANPSIFLAGEKIIRKANRGRVESGYFSINVNRKPTGIFGNPPKKTKSKKPINLFF